MKKTVDHNDIKVTIGDKTYCPTYVEVKFRDPHEYPEFSLNVCVSPGREVPDASLKIKDVIFNEPATIVLWADNTKTVVKAQGEMFDPEKGLAMAISKKALGNKHDYYIPFKKHLKKYYNEHSEESADNTIDLEWLLSAIKSELPYEI